MNGRQRREAIFEMARRRGFVSVEALAEQFAVSSQTIRRDIQYLCDSSLLVRHHGGAGLPSSIVKTDYAAKRVAQLAEKEAIAEAIAEFLPDRASLFMTIGTTAEITARALRKRQGLKVITNNLHVAEVLHPQPGFEVSVAGGTIRTHNGGIVGPQATQFVDHYRTDFAVISTGAVDPDGTLLDFYADEVSVAQAMMRNARQVILAVDHTKFTRTATVALAPIEDVTAVFTDRTPPEAIGDYLRRNGIAIHVCPPGGIPTAQTNAASAT